MDIYGEETVIADGSPSQDRCAFGTWWVVWRMDAA